MPSTPVFIADRATALLSLRMSHASVNDEAQAIIDNAITKVRIWLYDYLGSSRITEILVTAFTPDPSTPAELTRARAVTTELAMLRWRLLQDLPIQVLDAIGLAPQVWNAETLTREASSNQIDDMLERLKIEIDEGLDALKSGTAEGGISRVAIIKPTAEAKPITRPFDSVWKPRAGEGTVEQ